MILQDTGIPLEDVPRLAEDLPEILQEFIPTPMNLLNRYSLLFIAAFLVVLLVTPIVRRAAISANIVDHPDKKRKAHQDPVAYLGGLAVFLGLLAAISFSFTHWGGYRGDYLPIPFSIVLGIVVITFTGLVDDIWGSHPRTKLAGQLVAAAALAYEDVGVRVAEGFLQKFMGPSDSPLFAVNWLELTGGSLQLTNGNVYYWVGTAIIAFFVLGGCNAANLIDGLDGLLSGTMAIVAIGLLAISIIMAVAIGPVSDVPSLAGARVALCFALLGAVLGFLPHNFNPATIFLGDCGSLLLGYISVVIILMLGDEGQTHLVAAGLIVFALPIMDTALAIVRRKISGKPLSTADNQHIHHQLKRSLGGVKRAVFALYGINIVFAIVGVYMAALVVMWHLRVGVIYAIALVLFSFIGVIAFKAARQQELKAETELVRKRNAKSGKTSTGNGKMITKSAKTTSKT